ncbi:MAG: serine/threonine protein kinase [Legionellales bacterium]|nr:MAG: serine/threonine protein kinase [Legionellales bacterium]
MNKLLVYTNGTHVGTLVQQRTGVLSFTYALDWLQRDNASPISLSMALTENEITGMSVNNFFDNLLPDSELIRARIQARFQTKSNQCFELLTKIGTDCVGALQLLAEPLASDVHKIQAQPISHNDIAALLKNYRTAPLGMDPHTDFRISIAGAQEKTALLWHNNTWNLPQQSTPTSHILKLPIGRIEHAGIDLSDSVENEWLCLAILQAFNMPVNKAVIENFAGVKALVVERFDRSWQDNGTWLMRLLQEDLCQAIGMSAALKYESDGGPGIERIMQVLSGSCVAKADRWQFMKATFLFWVLGAIDGHAKNFSIFLQQHERYRLTPLYDVISAYPLAASRQLEWRDLKMAMALQGKNRHYHWHNMQLRHWIATAEKCQFPVQVMQDIIDEVFDDLEKVIDSVAMNLPDNFPEPIATAIFNGMHRVKNSKTA